MKDLRDLKDLTIHNVQPQGLIKWISLAVIGSLILKVFGVHLSGMDGLLASFGAQSSPAP